MLLTVFILVVSLAILVWSADLFVDGAAATSRHFGISPLVVGMIVIGFGTSAPELLVSTLSAFQGNPGLAVGNALGSNVSNIGLILGLTAVLSPIVVHSGLLRKEMPILLLSTLLFTGLVFDLSVSRLDGVLLIATFVGISVWLIRSSLKNQPDALGDDAEHMLSSRDLAPLGASVVRLLVGLVLLVISSKFLVDSAVDLAKSLGVSDLIIGLTVVAVGTSLPELASSLAAIRRKEHDMAIGNVIGSNLFNTLVAVGAAGALSPFTLTRDETVRDVGVVLALTFILYVFCVGWKGRQGRVSRLEGWVFLGCYFVYMGVLVASALP